MTDDTKRNSSRRINIDLLLILGTIILGAYGTVMINKTIISQMRREIDKLEGKVSHWSAIAIDNGKDIAVVKDRMKRGNNP